MATVLLIVNHDRAVVDALTAQLTAPPFVGQFHVSGATTLEEALGAFEVQPMDALVSDLDVAGTQLAEFARSRFPDLKVVFTADAPSADIESQVRAANGLGLVVQPLRAENIVALLSTAPAPVAPTPEPMPVAAPPPPPQENPVPPVAPAPAPVVSTPQVAVKAPTPPPAAPRAVVAKPATVVAKAFVPPPPPPAAPAPRAVATVPKA
ncbi:MAG: hypothetical protein WC740_22430, partial [Verrucomicrobiia bacterium]